MLAQDPASDAGEYRDFIEAGKSLVAVTDARIQERDNFPWGSAAQCLRFEEMIPVSVRVPFDVQMVMLKRAAEQFAPGAKVSKSFEVIKNVAAESREKAKSSMLAQIDLDLGAH